MKGKCYKDNPAQFGTHLPGETHKLEILAGIDHLLQWLANIFKNRFVFPKEIGYRALIEKSGKSRAVVVKAEVEVPVFLERSLKNTWSTSLV